MRPPLMPSPQDESHAPFAPPAASDRDEAAAPGLALLDRDHSILAFNERVLDWAYRPQVPLLQRLRYPFSYTHLDVYKRHDLHLAEDFLQLGVGVDQALVHAVLQAVLLDVDPQLADDLGARQGLSLIHV